MQVLLCILQYCSDSQLPAKTTRPVPAPSMLQKLLQVHIPPSAAPVVARAVGRPGCVYSLQHLKAITKMLCVQPAWSVAAFGLSLRAGEDVFDAYA